MIFVRTETNIPKRTRSRAPKFFDLQMGQIGAAGLKAFKERVGRAIGVDDAPAKPLTKRYARFKSKHGKGNRRNLQFTGDMLNNLTIRSATERQVRVAFTKTKERQKALANQRRSEFMPWAQSDSETVFEVARRIFKEEVVPGVIGAFRRK